MHGLFLIFDTMILMDYWALSDEMQFLFAVRGRGCVTAPQHCKRLLLCLQESILPRESTQYITPAFLRSETYHYPVGRSVGALYLNRAMIFDYIYSA